MKIPKYSKYEELELFDAYLDAAYPMIEIENLWIPASTILAKCSPTHYDEMFAEFCARDEQQHDWYVDEE